VNEFKVPINSSKTFSDFSWFSDFQYYINFDELCKLKVSSRIAYYIRYNDYSINRNYNPRYDHEYQLFNNIPKSLSDNEELYFPCE